MNPVVVDPMVTLASRRQDNPRQERHRFRNRVRAFWRRMSGLPDESEALVDGLALPEAPAAQNLRVTQILGGCQRMRRLLEIGIYPDAQIEVISAGNRGLVIVKVGETRLAMGRNVARSVMVEIVPAS